MRMLFLALLLLPQLGAAQIYKTTDAQGNVSYSDQPPASGQAEQVQLRETNTAPPPEVQDSPAESTAEDSATQPAAISYEIEITAPANETTIPMGPGNFDVQAKVSPAPQLGAMLQLYLDGGPYGAPQQGTSWSLSNVFRGAHDLTVAVVNRVGERLAESEPVRVYVLRPSINFRK